MTVILHGLYFWKRLRHVLYEAALQHLRLFPLTHLRIRGEPIAMFRITHGLLEFRMESTFTHPTYKGLRSHAYEFHQRRCCTRRRQFAFSIRAVPFWNKLPAEIVNASSTKAFNPWGVISMICQFPWPFSCSRRTPCKLWGFV